MNRESGKTNTARAAMTSGTSVYGTFVLGNDEYAIEMDGLQEVVDAPGNLQRMPLSPPYLAGIFHFRGRILPVVELSVLLQVDRPAEAEPETGPRRMAVIRKDAARLGILFDRLGEVIRVRQEDLTPLEQSASDIPVKAVIYRKDSDKVVQVLDFDALLSIRNLPTIRENSNEDESSRVLSSRMRDLYRDKLIGFTLGGCKLAVEMRWVHSILRNVPRQSSPRKSELCDSMVAIRGGLAPVIKTSKLFRIDQQQECATLLVAPLGGELIAFEVDQVTSIIPYSKERIIPIPVLDDYRAPVFRGCFTDRDGQDFIVLDERALLSRPEIESISTGHVNILKKQREAEADVVQVPAKTSILTFRLGRIYGLPLGNVVEVLVWPPSLTRTPDIPAAVMGMINLRGQPLPVIDPRALFPLEHEEPDASPRILVLQHEGRKLGMRVDSLDSIVSVPLDASHNMPEMFYRKDIERFDGSVERAVKTPTKTKDGTAVVLFHAEQIIAKLAAVLGTHTFSGELAA